MSFIKCIPLRGGEKAMESARIQGQTEPRHDGGKEGSCSNHIRLMGWSTFVKLYKIPKNKKGHEFK